MEKKSLVTIGVCVKNEESNIEEALRSIIDQDFPKEDMEIIVVDGYSKDKTVPIIKENLSKACIDFKILYDNNGLGRARQIVVENANTEYIIWLDADLIFSRDYVRKQVEFMNEKTAAGISKGRYGICSWKSLASFLENMSYVVESLKYVDKEAPRLVGTEGAIYRVKAIKQVGGFDGNIRGAAEDLEAAYRIRSHGWLFFINNSIFFEKCRDTWKDLWKEYVWWGIGGHYSFHKDKRIIPLYEMLPLSGLYAGLSRSFTAYRLIHRKSSFLMPLHYFFKRIAWWYGFIKAHFQKYGHSN